MRAARYYGKEDLRIEQIDEPQCLNDDDVKVAVSFTGICGTDLHEWAGGPTFAPQKGCPHGLTGEQIPIILGHEFSGTVHSFSPALARTRPDLVVGAPVAVQPMLKCNACPACKAGAPMACEHAGFVGLSGGGGGLSDFVVVPARMCFVLPTGLPLEIGALVEPLSVGSHAVATSGVRAGNCVLILGGGPIGISVTLSLKAAGVGLIVVSEVAPARKKFAATFGAAHVLDPTGEDIVARIKGLTSGVGADVVFDCAGVPASIETACKAVKARGHVVNIAIWEKAIPFNPNWLVFKEGRFSAVLGYGDEDYRRVIDGLSTEGGGMDKAGDMITKKIKLEEVVEKGFKTLLYDKDEHVKILVDLRG